MFKLTVFVAFCVLLICAVGNAQDDNGDDQYSETCVCRVTKEYVPICGADRVTYPNWRKLDCKNKCEMTNIKILHKGVCKSSDGKKQ